MKPPLEPLQAVNRIKTDIEISYLPIPNFKDKGLYLECLKTVETALKEDEKQLKTLKSMYGNLEKTLVKVNSEKEKYKKAFQIIKTKRVDIAHLQDSKDCGEYNEVVKKLATLWRVLPLTEEEYELLKEILK